MQTRRWLARSATLLAAGAVWAQAQTNTPPSAPAMVPLGMRPEGDLQARLLQNLTQDSAVLKSLGLTDEQVAALHKQTIAMQNQLIDLKERVDSTTVDQAKLFQTNAVDDGAVMKAFQQAGDLRTEMSKIQVQRLLAVRSTLTHEQRMKLLNLLQERMRQLRTERHPLPMRVPAAGPGAGPGAYTTSPSPPAPATH